MDEIRGITNTNTGRGSNNRRGWDDIGSGSSNNNASNDNQIVTEISTVEEGLGNTADGGITAVEDDTAIHIPEAFLVEDGYDDNGEVYIATPTLPWWKQKRTRILIGLVIVLVGALAIALGISLSQSNIPEQQSVISPPTITTTYECFDAGDGGRNGFLSAAVRSYVSQDCSNNKDCEIGQTYG